MTVADEGSALSDAVKTGGFGINLPPGQPNQLANALRDLAQNGQPLRDWSLAGREYVKRFDRDHVLSNFRTKLQDLLLTDE